MIAIDQTRSLGSSFEFAIDCLVRKSIVGSVMFYNFADALSSAEIKSVVGLYFFIHFGIEVCPGQK